MLLEAINSVFLTFLATEYLLSNQDGAPVNSVAANDGAWTKKKSFFGHLLATVVSQHSRNLRYAFVLVASINAFVHFHAAGMAIAQWMHDKVETLFRVPRILVAMASFLVALYWDCRQKHKRHAKNQTSPAPWSNRYFFRQVAHSFCKLLPVYPFLAVVISFGFLLVITVFEKLHLPQRMLNGPIYYGTLYGPLMMMYWDVKKTVAGCGNVLPR